MLGNGADQLVLLCTLPKCNAAEHGDWTGLGIACNRHRECLDGSTVLALSMTLATLNSLIATLISLACLLKALISFLVSIRESNQTTSFDSLLFAQFVTRCLSNVLRQVYKNC